MTEIWGEQWRDQNATINYPFSDRATLTNVAGNFLPPGALIDAVLHPPGGVSLYLTQATVTSESIVVFFGDEADKLRCSGAFPAGQESAEIRLTDPDGFAAGLLIVDPIQFSTLQSWGGGDHVFTRLETELVPSVCLPSPEAGVRRISTDAAALAGEVWWLGDDGVVLTVETQTTDEGTIPVVRVNAVGDPLYRRRLCEPRNLYAAARPIRCIRFVNDETGFEHQCCPEDGEVSIVVGDHEVRRPILRFLHADGRLKFKALGSLD
jgi:hypothetical protein